jgi:hypothetical protein
MCVCARVGGWNGVGVCAKALACACSRVALIIQHATSRHTAFLAAPNFLSSLMNGKIFGKKFLNTKCVF